MATSREYFHWLDYVIFSMTLLLSCGVGVYYAVRTKKQNKEEYLLGSRQMNWFPVGLSLVVTHISGISQLGFPAEIYQHGLQYIIGLIGILLGLIITMFIFVPMLFRLKLTSTYEYLDMRFQSKAVRCVGSLTIIISQLLYTGLATYSPAIALEAVTGFPVYASILCIGAVAIFYTILGGMKAVVSTDAFQAFVMLASILLIIIFGTIKVGGIPKIWQINKDHGRIFFNFDPSPLTRITFWSLLIGKCFGRLPAYTVHQASVQRYSCVSTLAKAKQILFLNAPCLALFEVLMCFIGMIIFSYVSDCDPLSHPDPELRVSSPNQLLPVFVMRVIGWPGIPGIFMAAIFSGSLSTVSSCLNAQATVTWEDFLSVKLDYLSERRKTHILKALAYGLGGTAFAFMASHLRGHVLQVSASFLDSANGPLLGLFILGAFFRRTNWMGSIVGCFVGFVLVMWISLGSYLAIDGVSPLPTSVEGCVWNGTSLFNVTTPTPMVSRPVEGINKLYTISFLWFPVIATLTTVSVGLLASAITAPFIKSIHPDDIKDDYLIFAFDNCFGKRQRRPFAEGKDAVGEFELKRLNESKLSPSSPKLQELET